MEERSFQEHRPGLCFTLGTARRWGAFGELSCGTLMAVPSLIPVHPSTPPSVWGPAGQLCVQWRPSRPNPPPPRLFFPGAREPGHGRQGIVAVQHKSFDSIVSTLLGAFLTSTRLWLQWSLWAGAMGCSVLCFRCLSAREDLDLQGIHPSVWCDKGWLEEFTWKPEHGEQSSTLGSRFFTLGTKAIVIS